MLTHQTDTIAKIAFIIDHIPTTPKQIRDLEQTRLGKPLLRGFHFLFIKKKCLPWCNRACDALPPLVQPIHFSAMAGQPHLNVAELTLCMTVHYYWTVHQYGHRARFHQHPELRLQLVQYRKTLEDLCLFEQDYKDAMTPLGLWLAAEFFERHWSTITTLQIFCPRVPLLAWVNDFIALFAH